MEYSRKIGEWAINLISDKMRKVEFTTEFLKGLTFDQLEDIVIQYRDRCQDKDRYFHYEQNDSWNLREMQPGMVMDFVVRNNDELSFNNYNYHVDNDVAMVCLRTDYSFAVPVGNKGVPLPNMSQVFETSRRIVNCEPAKDGNGMGHLRSSLLIGAHQIRSHAPGGKTSRTFKYHKDGWGKGELKHQTLERIAICQRIDEPVPVLRTDGKGKILKGYSDSTVSWEVGRGFNDHDVSSNSSLGCITTPRVNGTDDRYMHNFRPYLIKAKVKSRAALCLIGCDALMEICDKLHIDYTATCKVFEI